MRKGEKEKEWVSERKLITSFTRIVNHNTKKRCFLTLSNMSLPVVYLTRKEHFSSAHQLQNVHLSNEENRKIFGKCFNIHGHNYILKITIKGLPHPQTGMVMNINDFKKIIQDKVLIKLDHKFIDNDIEEFKLKPSTCENLTIWIWQQIEPHLPEGVLLHRIKLRETENNYAEFDGSFINK